MEFYKIIAKKCAFFTIFAKICLFPVHYVLQHCCWFNFLLLLRLHFDSCLNMLPTLHSAIVEIDIFLSVFSHFWLFSRNFAPLGFFMMSVPGSDQCNTLVWSRGGSRAYFLGVRILTLGGRSFFFCRTYCQIVWYLLHVIKCIIHY